MHYNYIISTVILYSGHTFKEVYKRIFNQILFPKNIVCKKQYPILGSRSKKGVYSKQPLSCNGLSFFDK